MEIEKRLEELGIELPALPAPTGTYVHAVRHGDLLFLAGKDPIRARGKVGRDFSVEEAYGLAREVGLVLITVMKDHLGDLDRVAQVVKVLGMVNATPEFEEHPAVINGCSDLFVEVFGEKGRHARSAVGMGSLPSQIPVEIECIVGIEG